MGKGRKLTPSVVREIHAAAKKLFEANKAKYNGRYNLAFAAAYKARMG
jgi:hypothetical protein